MEDGQRDPGPGWAPPSMTPTRRHVQLPAPRQVWLEAWGPRVAHASPGEPSALPSRLKGHDTGACLGDSPGSGGAGPGLGGGASLRMKH